MTILKLFITFAAVSIALLSGDAPALKPPGELRASPNQTHTHARNPHSVNPLEIKRLINESKRVAKKSGVRQDVNLVPMWKDFGIDERPLENCGAGDCEAETIKLDLDGQFPDEVVLKINNTHFCRFLVFTPNGASGTVKVNWTFRGHIDWDFNRYEMARQRMVKANGRQWLVIRAQAGSGTGYSLFQETFYELTPDGLRSVVSYPIEGNTYPWPTGLGRSFRARVQPGTNGELVVVYEVDYVVARYADDKSRNLAVNRHRVCYTWNTRQREFVFSSGCSNISEEEIAAIAGIETGVADEGEQIGATTFYSTSDHKAFVGGGYDVFLKYNFPVLMKIANSKNEAERDWLRLFLKDCDDTPKKTELLDALAKK